MSRILAVTVVIAAFGVVIATHSSSAAGPAARPARAVTVTPRLKQLLQAEISTMRRGQPAVPRTVPRVGSRVPSIPERGAPCFVAGAGPCSEIPCKEFVSAPAVLKTSTEIVGPGAHRGAKSTAPACSRRRQGKLVLVSGR